MITHAIYNQLANESIRVELVYENSPLIAGSDELSAIIRFRYIGKKTEATAQEGPKEPQVEKKSDSWSGLRRISTQLSSNARALFLNELESLAEEEHDTDQTLILGYVQVLSSLVTNPEVVDDTQLDPLRKQSIIGGKLCGISGLEVDEPDSGLLKVFEGKNKASIANVKPIYSSNQSILFSDLTFNQTSQDVRSYYVSFKLPADLPPSYESGNLKIQHNLVLGYQLAERGRISNKTMFFPLKIQAYVNSRAQQHVFNLTTLRLNDTVEDEKILTLSEGFSFEFQKQPQPQIQRQHSRKMSFRAIKKNFGITDKRTRRTPSMSSLNSVSQKLAEETEEDARQREVFAKYITELNSNSVNDVVKIQSEYEAEAGVGRDVTTSPREELLSVFADTSSIKGGESEPGFECLIPSRLQSKFLLRVNGEDVYKVTFNKTVFKVGDIISINVQLNNELNISGLETTLKQVETFVDEDYLLRTEYGELSVREAKTETPLVSKSVSTFQTQEVNQDIHIPHTITSQFSSDIVRLSYILELKCILIPAKQHENAHSRQFELVPTFKDEKGILYKPMDYFTNGRELKCRLPVVVLPTYEQDFGFVLNNR